jgi:hypothetical protein
MGGRVNTGGGAFNMFVWSDTNHDNIHSYKTSLKKYKSISGDFGKDRYSLFLILPPPVFNEKNYHLLF